MKISFSALALSTLLCPMAEAFMPQASNRRFALSTHLNADKYSYLGNLNEENNDDSKDDEKPAAAPQTFAAPPASVTPAPAPVPSPNLNWSTPGSSITSAPAPVSNAPPAQEPVASNYSQLKPNLDRFADMSLITVQGGSLRTCPLDGTTDRVNVCMKTNGRPLNANLDLWQGPDNTPQKMSIYLEDGSERPFCATIESPGSSNTVAIRNTGSVEYPLVAGVETDKSGEENGPASVLLGGKPARTIQGGAVYTTPFLPSVQSIQVMLKSDGRPLSARVELLQGPNNNKQIMEVYSEDGNLRPFYVVIETPGTGNVVRIVNTATIEYPLSAKIEPYLTDENATGKSGPSASGLTWS